MVSRGRRATLVIVAVVLLLLIGGRVAAELVVELLWYRSLDLERIFWTLWGAGLGIRALLALPVGLLVFGNLWIISRSLGTIRVRRRYANIEIAEQLPQSYIVGALLLISLLSAWWLSGGASDPLAALAFVQHQPWGTVDPVFGRDVGFYVFRLPVLGRLQTLAGLLVFWIALLVSAAYVATGAIRLTDGQFHASMLARRHLGALLGAFLLVLAWDAWLDRYGLLLNGSGVGGALGYTDVHARLPGKWIVILLTLLAAGAVVYGAWKGRTRLPLISLGLLVVGWIGSQLIYPVVVQKLAVEPNEFPRERPFIEQHLEFTRNAYGLADLRRERFPYRPPRDLTEERLLRVLSGVPLWDERPLLEAYNQKQSLFPYYDFVSVHADRYGPPGAEQQVAISVRELEPGKLPSSAQTWQNLHLTYVSGEGVVAGPVAEMTEGGAPVFYLQDLDPPKLAPTAPAELRLETSEVYFAERTRGYVILGPERGVVGVPLDAAWKKLIFAWAFQSKNLLLSDEVTPDSRVVYQRQIVERARAVAPFLHFSPRGALPVVAQGRVLWMLDGYTSSASYPLAPDTVFEGMPVRYLRNSAKVIVDGLSGEVQLYGIEPNDPILGTYSRIFPGLIRPLEAMPEELRHHLRVPAPLLTLQAQVLGEYHMADPQAFYRKQDVWARATENYRNESALVEATYTTLPLPGEGQNEFLLTLPLVPRGRHNLTALLVARNDLPHYGERVLFEMPRDELVAGTQQIEAMIDQNPEISQQLSLWRQGGSDVVRGHLVVVPLDSTLVYVEPLYLVADNSAIPQLERVILAAGNQVVMRSSLEQAVAALLGTEPASPDETAEPGEPSAEQEERGPESDEVFQQARRLLEQAEGHLRAGDWARFGRSWEALRELLRAPSEASPDGR